MARRLECPMCGRYNKRSQNFCSGCGTRVNKSAPSVEISNTKEVVPISKVTKRRNSALIIAAVLYVAALFIPLIDNPVMDGASIAISPIMLGVLSFSIIGNSTNLLTILIGAFALAAVVMTVAFLVCSINNAKRYREGGQTLFGRNVLYLVTIPTLYLLILFIYGIEYGCNALALMHVGLIFVWAVAIISVIRLAVLSIDKNRVSKKSVRAAIVAVVCFVIVFICLFQPIFSVSITNGEGITSGFEFSAQHLRRFYDSTFLANHYRDIAQNGVIKVITNAESRLHNSSDKGGALATIMMTTLSSTIPMVMVISVVVMIISASAIFSTLLTKLCTLNEKKIGLLVAKAILVASSASFLWSLVQMILAVAKIRYMLSTLSTMTFSIMAYPVIAIVASLVIIFLNVKEKNYDYIVVNK